MAKARAREKETSAFWWEDITSGKGSVQGPRISLKRQYWGIGWHGGYSGDFETAFVEAIEGSKIAEELW